MLKGILSVVLAALLVAAPLQQARANSDTTADVLRVALPAAAWGMTQYLDDNEGSKQFYYSFASTIVATYALKTAVHKSRRFHPGIPQWHFRVPPFCSAVMAGNMVHRLMRWLPMSATVG